MWTEAGVSGGGVASPGDPTVPPHGPEWALPLINLNATSDQARAAACPCSDRVSTEPQSLRGCAPAGLAGRLLVFLRVHHQKAVLRELS